MPDKVAALLVQYAHYHRDPRNIATHYAGIPLIVFAIGVMLARLSWPLAGLVVSADVVVFVLAVLWYLWQGRSGLVLGNIAAMGTLLALAHPLGQADWPTWLAAGPGAFVVGWALQFAGHFWEGRKPAFFDDLRGLLVGPLFVTAEAWFALGGGRALREHIEREAGPVARQTPRQAQRA
jgi:uncharacterized membrane protein YGL010W